MEIPLSSRSTTEEGHPPVQSAEVEASRQMIQRLAATIVRMNLSPVAILFIESARPLNFVGSQLLHVFSPLVNALGHFPDYETLSFLLEDRRNVDLLLEAIEREEVRKEADEK